MKQYKEKSSSKGGAAVRGHEGPSGPKGKKKEALIRGDIDSLKKLSLNKKNREKMNSASTRPSASQN